MKKVFTKRESNLMSLVLCNRKIVYLCLFLVFAAECFSETVVDEGSNLNLRCSVDESQNDKIKWFYSLPNLRPQTILAHDVDGTLSIYNVTLANVGRYECLDGTSKIVTSENVYVRSNDSLLVPLSPEERFVIVNAGSKAILPCRLADPSDSMNKLELIGQTGEVIDLDESGIVYDQTFGGFVIVAGNVRFHSGILRCRAFRDDLEDTQDLHLFFKFEPTEPIPGSPEVAEANPNGQILLDCDPCNDLSLSLHCRLVVPASIPANKVSLIWNVTSNQSTEGIFHENSSITNDENGTKTIINHLTTTNWTLVEKVTFSCVATTKTSTGNDVTQSTEIDILSSGGHDSSKGDIWDLSTFNAEIVVPVGRKGVRWVVGIRTGIKLGPFVWRNQKGDIISGLRQKYSVIVEENDPAHVKIICHVYDVSFDDMGDYRLEVSTKENSKVTASLDMRLRVLSDRPRVAFVETNPALFYQANRFHNFTCQIVSYPMNLTRVEFGFTNCSTLESCDPNSSTALFDENGLTEITRNSPDVKLSFHQGLSTYRVNIQFTVFGGSNSGLITCKSCISGRNCSTTQTNFFLTDLSTGDKTEISGPADGSSTVGDTDVSIKCRVSRLVFSSIAWYRKSESEDAHDEPSWHLLGNGHFEETMKVVESWTNHSFLSEIFIDNISHHHAGIFWCRPKPWSNKIEEENLAEELQFSLKVLEIIPASVDHSQTNLVGEKINFRPGKTVIFKCPTYGNPVPTISWMKDDKPINLKSQFLVPKKRNNSSSSEYLYVYTFNLSPDNTSLNLSHSGLVKQQQGHQHVEGGDPVVGKYSCTVANRGGTASAFAILAFPDKNSSGTSTSTIIGVIFAIVVIFGLVLTVAFFYHRRKLRAAKEEMDNFIQRFKLGDPEALESLMQNDESADSCSLEDDRPHMDREKAQMLPYDPKWEMEMECLKLGPEIGSGAFGRVVRAEIEVDDAFAADHEAVGLLLHKAFTLQSRSSTSSSSARNRHKITVAVKMLKYEPELSEFKALVAELKIMAHLGQHENLVNLLGACTSQIRLRKLYVVVEFCPNGNLLEILHRYGQKFLPLSIEDLNAVAGSESDMKNLFVLASGNTANTLPPVTNGYISVQEACLSFTYQKTEKKLSSAHLISWSRQISDGMAYLNRQRVLHGDLACRNVLLSTDNIVKIGDFGLSKYTYRTGGIYRKENGEEVKLPIKWLAPESIRQLVFTTKSDVWSYGVLLWELFSLGQSPYPHLEAGPEFIEAILDRGERLRKPEYASDSIFIQIMNQCWADEPADRPSFEEISRRWVNLVDIERRHLPTFDEKWSTNSTSVGYHVSKSVDNEMYFNEGELCS